MRLEEVTFTPPFICITNTSPKPVAIGLKPVDRDGKSSESHSVVIGARKTSPPIASRALRLPIGRLAERYDITFDLWWAIGPPEHPRCVGSYYGEDVYVCYECGQPIVFRYAPPRPIHV